MEEDLKFFKEEMTYIFSATRDLICSDCLEIIPEDSFFYFRIEGITEKHYCRKCGAEITGFYDDPFFVTPARLMIKNIEIVDRIPEEGLQILQCVQIHDVEKLRHLLKNNNAYVNTRNFHRKTPLMKSLYDSTIISELLLEYGADVNAGIDGWTPLHEAITLRRTDLISLLLSFGADVNRKENQLGRTPLHIAGSVGSIFIAKLLLEQGAETNVKDKEGMTYVELAYKCGFRKFPEEIMKQTPPVKKRYIIQNNTNNDDYSHNESPILLSACLAGVRCRFDGKIKLVEELKNLADEGIAITVCPEIAGGMPAPRPPSEIVGGTGEDLLRSRGIISETGEINLDRLRPELYPVNEDCYPGDEETVTKGHTSGDQNRNTSDFNRQDFAVTSNSQRSNVRIINKNGKDVTNHYIRGAIETLKTAKKYDIREAILKARSPACGIDKIYDGTFSKTLIDGNGVAAELLMRAGIVVVTEEGWLEGSS